MTREIERIEHDNTPALLSRSANDNRRQGSATVGHSVFPVDAEARIFKPGRSVMTSGKARTKDWWLVFERRSAPYIEPLTGWTGGNDTLTQVELTFPTLKAAVAYAERQGFNYRVERNSKAADADRRGLARRKRAFSDVTLDRLGLRALQESYGHAMAHGANSSASGSAGTEAYTAAMRIVTDLELSLDDKRSILMNWAWHEYLNDQAIAGMPENGRPSRLHEIELALLALEKCAANTTPAGPAGQIAA